MKKSGFFVVLFGLFLGVCLAQNLGTQIATNGVSSATTIIQIAPKPRVNEVIGTAVQCLSGSFYCWAGASNNPGNGYYLTSNTSVTVAFDGIFDNRTVWAIQSNSTTFAWQVTRETRQP
jgi:hypothetical protein